MKKKTTFALFIVALLSTISLHSCDENEPINVSYDLLGKWRLTEYSSYGGSEGMYKTTEKHIVEYMANGILRQYYEDGSYEGKYQAMDGKIYFDRENEHYLMADYKVVDDYLYIEYDYTHSDNWCLTGATKAAIYKRIK